MQRGLNLHRAGLKAQDSRDGSPPSQEKHSLLQGSYLILHPNPTPCSKMGYLKSAQMLPFEGHLAKLAKHEPIWVPRWWPYNDTLVSTMTTLAMVLRSCRNIDPLLQKLFSNFQKNRGLLPNPTVFSEVWINPSFWIQPTFAIPRKVLRKQKDFLK